MVGDDLASSPLQLGRFRLSSDFTRKPSIMSLLLLSSASTPPPPSRWDLTIDGKAYRLNGELWTYAGSTDFKMARLLADGVDVSPVVRQRKSAGANAVRLFDYVPVKDWGNTAWDSPSIADTVAAIRWLNAQGLFVELTLLTDDDPNRIPPAIRLIEAVSGLRLGLRLEAGNEPNTHKSINTHALIPAMQASGYQWSTGDYENSAYWRGTFGTFHPARTFDFVRRAHDAYEYWNGGGPNSPSEPPCRVPWDNDEPIRPDQCGFDRVALRAHGGATKQFCGGGTAHTESGKFSRLWTEPEESCVREFYRGLHAFPAGIQNSPDYRRIVEPGNEPGGPREFARTYVVGNSMVRCQQVGTACPEPGWTSLDEDGILWTR